ncbi:1818_t:CDS:2, partial [Ambispora gerdemannii]
VINVDSDGNYRYRVLAVCLRRNESEWPEMKKKLQEELNKREQFYQSLFLVNGDYVVIMREISWMDDPSLAMAFVNNNHYVVIMLKSGAPVSPIINRWIQFVTLAATKWKLLIQDRSGPERSHNSALSLSTVRHGATIRQSDLMLAIVPQHGAQQDINAHTTRSSKYVFDYKTKNPNAEYKEAIAAYEQEQ